MNIVSATNAKTRFGEILLESIKQPVLIEKHKKNVAVLMSLEEYNKLQELSDMEDEILGKLAVKSDEKGYIDTKTSKKLMDEILSA